MKKSRLDRLIESERIRTAQHRFFIFTGSIRDTYRFSVCDGEAEPKTIARFKDEYDAETFLVSRRNRYVEQGE